MMKKLALIPGVSLSNVQDRTSIGLDGIVAVVPSPEVGLDLRELRRLLDDQEVVVVEDVELATAGHL